MLEYKVGEKQYVSATVRPETANEIAVVNAASYEFSCYESDAIIDRGECEIEGDSLRVLLDFLKAGFFTLKIIAQVGKETIIGTKTISVKE